jgi:hypothetical protein
MPVHGSIFQSHSESAPEAGLEMKTRYQFAGLELREFGAAGVPGNAVNDLG